jgi:hypothetical protein
MRHACLIIYYKVQKTINIYNLKGQLLIGKRLRKDGRIIVELKSAKEILMLGAVATAIRRSPYYCSSIAYEFVLPT